MAIVNLEIHCALPKLHYGDQCRLFRYRALSANCSNPQFTNQNKAKEATGGTESEGSCRNYLGGKKFFFSTQDDRQGGFLRLESEFVSAVSKEEFAFNCISVPYRAYPRNSIDQSSSLLASSKRAFAFLKNDVRVLDRA